MRHCLRCMNTTSLCGMCKTSVSVVYVRAAVSDDDVYE